MSHHQMTATLSQANKYTHNFYVFLLSEVFQHKTPDEYKSEKRFQILPNADKHWALKGRKTLNPGL